MKTAIIIPCFNEANRLSASLFRLFVSKHRDYHLCFVNDGSNDATLSVLRDLRQGLEKQVSILDLPKNMGKAEAVRRGMLYVLRTQSCERIGFLDADLSTDFCEFVRLVNHLEASPNVKVVVGARVRRLGAEIHRNAKRHLIGRAIAFLIGKMLGMPIYDTQCGAKVFRREVVKPLFSKPFTSKWLFDVEIFFRIRQIFGVQTATKTINEIPLQRWIHVGDSRITAKESIRIPLQILAIGFRYNTQPKFEYLRKSMLEKIAVRSKTRIPSFGS